MKFLLYFSKMSLTLRLYLGALGLALFGPWIAFGILNVIFPPSPLVDAAAEGQWSQVQSLLNRHALANQTDDRGKTALMWAALYGKLDMASALIKNGANVNAENAHGCSVLCYAESTIYANGPMIRFLKKSGAKS